MNVCPELVKVNAPRPSIVKFAVPLFVSSDVPVIASEPYIVVSVVLLHATEFPVLLQVIDFPARGMSSVTVCDAENADEITTSSCGNGTRDVQAFVDQLPPLVPDQV